MLNLKAVYSVCYFNQKLYSWELPGGLSIKGVKSMKFSSIFTLFCFAVVQNSHNRDFSGGPVVKNPLCNAGDVGLIPGRGTEIPYATTERSCMLQ